MNRISKITATLAAVAGGLSIAGAAGALPLANGSGGDAGESVMVPLTPARILDTRNAIGVGGTTPVGAGETIDLQVTGAGGVPTGATSVVLNLTAVGATSPTYLTAWADGETMPTASVINATPGEDVANMVTLTLPENGRIRLYNSAGDVHVVADVAGYYKELDNKLLFAVVEANGDLDRSDGVTNAQWLATGEYNIQFERDVSMCAFTASTGSIGSNTPPAEFATVYGQPGLPQGVRVKTFDHAGADADSSFHLLILCP